MNSEDNCICLFRERVTLGLNRSKPCEKIHLNTALICLSVMPQANLSLAFLALHSWNNTAHLQCLFWKQGTVSTLTSVPPLCKDIVDNMSRTIHVCESAGGDNSMNGFICANFLKPVATPERMVHRTGLGQ